MSIQERISYGASELKRLYNRNLNGAFVISLAVHGLLILLYVVCAGNGTARTLKLPGVPGVIEYRGNDPVKQKPTEKIKGNGSENGSHTSQPPMGDPAGRRTPSGTKPTPVPDNLLPNDSSQFPLFNELPGNPFGSPDGKKGEHGNKGDDTTGQSGHENSGRNSHHEEEPSFVPYEVEPHFDMAELQQRVHYPDLARRNGIEGKVIVQVRISETGTPVRAIVESSDNQLLNDAAIQAVLTTAFTPAQQNKQPLAVWIAIPIDFHLR